ncbi:uncharacterized protein LOC131302618 isoform X3 [Rhododendron vialii]|uniref:uncharacterized protein LOC131302618 isoform X3 n=1 Tax=Rhododendron vialii TaxID=182163 RepID=UPI00265F649F|nr:uncharacterized protein LOC131302618 isoform X3 [Rhododendron vialii]
MKLFFIDIMEEEVKTMGSRDTGTFQIKSWARMRKSLSTKAKYEYSELQIKNKFNQLCTMHTKFKSLCDQSGVGWCAEKGTVTADDTLWEKLYKITWSLKKANHQSLSTIYASLPAMYMTVKAQTQSLSSWVFKFYSKEDLIVESEQGRRSSSQQINVTPAQLREMARVRNTIARQIFNSQRL